MDTTYTDLAKLVVDVTKPQKMLDVPAGLGYLTQEFINNDVPSVDCIDILDESNFPLKDKVTYHRCDINNPLPLESEAYDCVVSREGIEHLVTPYAFLHELCRLVCNQGYLVVTTPNIMSIDSRMRYLMTGYFRGFRELRDNHSGLRDLEFQGHISPIYYWQLAYFLENAGFEIVRLTTNRQLNERKPLKKLSAKLFKKLIRSTAKRRGMYDEMTHSDDLLFGDSLIVIAQKKNDPVKCHGERF